MVVQQGGFFQRVSRGCANQALGKAHLMALEKLAAKEQDKRVQAGYQWTLDGLKAELKPVILAEEILTSYAGSYGPRKITFENGSLFYQREKQAKMKMIPMADEYFRFTEIEYFRLKFVKKDGQVTGLEGHYNDGSINATPRDN